MQKRTYNYSENHLASIVKLSHIVINTNDNFKLNEGTSEWVRELLVELNEKDTEKSEEEKIKDTQLNISFNISKKHNQQYGEYALVKIEIDGNFTTECVKTLKTLKDIVHIKFQACFLNESFKDDEEHSELTELFIDNEVYELYFQNRADIDLKECIHEQIYLNINLYPELGAEETQH